MSGSFCYSLKVRFYGLLFQLPWSFFVTVCVLMPVVYVADQQTRALLIELTIYWTSFTALMWLVKDIYWQRFLFEFSIHGRHLRVYKKNTLVSTYALNQIKKVKEIYGDDGISKAMPRDGIVITFDDGYKVRVFDQISNYKELSKIVCSNAMTA